MAQFSVNASRFDPYKNFKFRIKWDGRYVAGVSKVSALKRTTEVVKHREGGDPSTSQSRWRRTSKRIEASCPQRISNCSIYDCLRSVRTNRLPASKKV